MLSKQLAKQALDDAYRAHFAKLFGVLLGDPSDLQFTRFMRGFRNAVEGYGQIEKVIEEWEPPKS